MFWVVVVDMPGIRILMSCGAKSKSKKWKEVWKTKALSVGLKWGRGLSKEVNEEKSRHVELG